MYNRKYSFAAEINKNVVPFQINCRADSIKINKFTCEVHFTVTTCDAPLNQCRNVAKNGIDKLILSGIFLGYMKKNGSLCTIAYVQCSRESCT